MSNSLIDISGKIDSSTVDVFELINATAAELGIPYVVVGATARDLVMHYGYGAKIARATMDVDFGIQLSGWSDFEVFKNSLMAKGFETTRNKHSLTSRSGRLIDIIPFGGIQDEAAEIHWPPDGDFTMSVLGFQEVFDNAERVRVSTTPVIDINVAKPEGMVLLKFIAWMERSKPERLRDSTDLIYLFGEYEVIPTVRDKIYEGDKPLTRYDFDSELVGAWYLGKASRELASDKTFGHISVLLEGRHGSLKLEQLLDEMAGQTARQFARCEALLSSFSDGFLGDPGLD